MSRKKYRVFKFQEKYVKVRINKNKEQTAGNTIARLTPAGLYFLFNMPNLSKFYDYFYLFRQKFFGALSYLSSFFYIRIYLIVLFGFNLLLWLIVYFINLNVSQDLVILHYNVDFGVDLIGGVKRIFIIPLLGLIIILINVVLLFGFSRRKDFKFFAHLLLATCLIVNLFLLMALGSIYLINFR